MFEKSVNAEEGVFGQYKYSTKSENEYLDVTVNKAESWVKLLPENYELNSHFKTNSFEQKNGAGEGVCNGRTVEVTITNKSPYRINKWDILYEVPCDMYFDKAWNGTVEIHQYDDKNIETIATEELPDAAGSLEVNQFEELYVIPLKKGDKIIYHPAEYECPLVENTSGENANISKTIGLIVYTEDDDFEFDQFNVRYYVVRGLEEYPLYSALTLMIMIFGVASLGSLIFLIVTVRYDKIHKHDMEIISQAIGTFSKFIDSKDRYTNNHSYRVAGYSRLIAKKLGMTETECDDIYYIGLLHDTGKIVIDDKILNKPGRLTSQEYEVIKSHTTKGADILKDFTAIDNITVGALYHHERYDGRGYPTGLMGEDIPLIARIIAVADAYDAMSSTRCYRAQLDNDKIIEQLEINKGKQFDPELVDVFLKCILSGEADSIRRSTIES
ncbi:MAG: HD-GYP domain-containing protein [Lachnospiraceae bacterium]|nr:HD-GYP domain-containing protein [Lachnospiraceae bacterium]